MLQVIMPCNALPFEMTASRRAQRTAPDQQQQQRNEVDCTQQCACLNLLTEPCRP
jgi:hypothetical protein